MLRGGTRRDRPWKPEISDDFEQIDHKTCVSICDAIGERLQQSLRAENDLSPRLRELIDELRRRDNEVH